MATQAFWQTFTPCLWKRSNLSSNIVQMGWRHQLVNYLFFNPSAQHTLQWLHFVPFSWVKWPYLQFITFQYCWWFRNPANQLQYITLLPGFIHVRWFFGISEPSRHLSGSKYAERMKFSGNSHQILVLLHPGRITWTYKSPIFRMETLIRTKPPWLCSSR